ncbi:hypothetical protein [Nocardia brasiliensis]|uniref:hypothetical protein n=1 Tax=Nocardia brasiliensis TaxID=37326 RepID=UPI002456355F|nr:hypothetical protein [Nocardia brasiliensis]
MSDYRDAYTAGRAAYDRGEPSVPNPYMPANPHAGHPNPARAADLDSKAARLARLWLSGWQAGRDATESSRT